MSDSTTTIETNSADETRAWAERWAATQPLPLAVALSGELGAGKSELARGIARGVGVTEARLPSPTFTILATYEGSRDGEPLRVFHYDWYRLETPDEAEVAGVVDALDDPRGVTIVEWAERIAAYLPRFGTQIVIEHLGGDRRRIRVSAGR
jgi:tRNA threonylcarbamoyladenosine biosynthesis protein TsaE